MKILTVLLLLAQYSIPAHTGAPAGGAASLAYVNGSQTPQLSNPTIVATYTCATGNFLWITGSTNASGAGPSVTMPTPVTTTGNTISLAHAVDSTTNLAAGAWYVSTCNGTAGTYTLTPSTGANGTLIIQEYSKGSLAGIVDSITSCPGATVGANLACSATSTAAGELMIANVFANNSVSSWPAASGFNTRIDTVAGASPNSGYDLIGTASGTNTFPSTYNALNSDTITFAVVIK